ncbi:MAG TPA: tRNA dihydrouridine(20/20a) synthase DusA [Patescibacteria group bacterium]|nr:tRNA dihydrouridine(20/20a) synthase DusA [Patescibacteria group bacterium]
MSKNARYIAVAPMMDWTDRHCRFFHRLLSPNVHLYTEMVTTGAILHGDRERFLRFSPAEHPVALQLGGSDPDQLAECAKIGTDYGYDEINLNCGCPSDKVQQGRFGACLMAEPELVAECVSAMAKAVSVPVTVKCRIGIDDSEEFSFLNKFVKEVSQAGCKRFIVHARKAWLNGLSPKENREVPPLRYEIVTEIKEAYPDIEFILNGGVKTIDQLETQLAVFHGVMIGREAYQNPWLLAEIEKEIHGANSIVSRETVALAMIPYIERQRVEFGTPAKSITRHMLGLFNGQRGARQWRRYLSENAPLDTATGQIIMDALKSVKSNLSIAA